jgi:hypothetical protein
MAIEIVDLPIKLVIFHSYVSLPEGVELSISFPPWALPLLCLLHLRFKPIETQVETTEMGACWLYKRPRLGNFFPHFWSILPAKNRSTSETHNSEAKTPQKTNGSFPSHGGTPKSPNLDHFTTS